MNGELFLKISQRKERVSIIEALLVFPVAALHFAIVPGCVRTDQLMLDAQFSGGFLEKSRNISLGIAYRTCPVLYSYS